MDASSYLLSALATLGVLGVAGLLALVHRRITGITGSSGGAGSSGSADGAGSISPRFWRGALVAGGTACLVALATFPLTAAPPLYCAPVAALGALFGVLATAPLRARSHIQWSVALVSTLSTALVFTPAAALSFGIHTDQLNDQNGTGVGLIDFSGALPGLIAGGCVALGYLAFRSVARGVRATKRNSRAAEPSTLSWRALIPVSVLLVVGSLAWSLGLELAVDGYLGLIAGTVLLMAAGGLVGGVIIERVHRRQNTPAGSLLGLLAGLAASAPASASLTPVIAFVSALVIGGLCALLPRSGPTAVLSTLVVASSASLLALGALAANMSFIYTGQPEVLFTQASALLPIAAGGLVWGALVQFVLGRLAPRDPA